MTSGALRYLDGLGAPFIFLEERFVTLKPGELMEVKNILPKIVFVLEGSMGYRLGSDEPGLLRPGSVLINFENRSHAYLPQPGRRSGQPGTISPFVYRVKCDTGC